MLRGRVTLAFPVAVTGRVGWCGFPLYHYLYHPRPTPPATHTRTRSHTPHTHTHTQAYDEKQKLYAKNKKLADKKASGKHAMKGKCGVM